MVEVGKRIRGQKDFDNDKNQKRKGNEDEKRNDELVVYRILCPDEHMGNVIGKGGKIINSIRQETKSKIKVVDPFPGCKSRVLTIYCYVMDKKDVETDQEFQSSEPLCGAQDALLRIHSTIANAVANSGDSKKKSKEYEECQLIVPASQSANIIGKAGVTVKKLRSRSKANIRINSKDPSDPSHSCALDFDNFVSISGDSDAVRKALFAVSAIMYKFSPREEMPLEITLPEAPPIIIPADIPIYRPNDLYHGSDSLISSRTVPPILGSSHLSDLSSYADGPGSWLPFSSTLPASSGFGISSRSEFKLRILCPVEKAGRVIGKGGVTIKSIRQASGANVEVNDKNPDRGYCLVTVSATESLEDLKSVAVEAAILLQEKINDEPDGSVTFKIVVPTKVVGCVIGKSGAIINDIRKKTKTEIHISKDEKFKFLDPIDEIVEVTGKPGNVRDAVVQVVLRLRDDALKEQDGGRNSATNESLYSASSAPLLSSITPISSLTYDQRVEPGSGSTQFSSGSAFGADSLQGGDSRYGLMSAYSSSKLFGGLPPTTTLEILVPAEAVSRVMGKGGSNLSNFRKISGAMIEMSEPKSAGGHRIILITGTTDQRRAAENLIQAFIMAT